MDIRWDRPEVKARYEEMVSVLIKRLHTEAERIDGSGGDDGRDVQVPTPSGLIIYQLKSFTGRLGYGGRKRQVAKSLSRAAQHNPISWNLVVPLDPTTTELDWFRTTTGSYGFPCHWLGRTWLDSEMAQRPDIARYFLEDCNAEVLRWLNALRTTDDLAVGDAQDAIRRVRQIAATLDDIDPYYRYALVAGADGVPPAAGAVFSVQVGTDRVDVIPKYRTAIKDRPITVNAVFKFGCEHSALLDEFRRTVEWGDPVELPPDVVKSLRFDAPAGLCADVSEGGRLLFGPAQESLAEPIPVFGTVLGPDGETRLGTHQFSMTRRRAGQTGVVLEGMDITGLIALSLRLDGEAQRLNSKITFSAKPVLPAVGVIAARWLTLLKPPNGLLLNIGSEEGGRTEASIEEPIVGEGLAAIYEAFEAIQVRARTRFPVPADLTDEEIASVRRVAHWLSPEKLQIRWTHQTLRLSGATRESVQKLLEQESGGLLVTQDVDLEFRGRMLQLGRLARTQESAIVVNAEEFSAALDRGDSDITLELEPGHSDIAYEWLLEPGGHMNI